ncbi:hypothetical protein Y032_0534g3062 [Ancylostoma ceylanicum]|nr:hypothetical protein Y032_0534g3062 [Ancylostoma ceylanicum]
MLCIKIFICFTACRFSRPLRQECRRISDTIDLKENDVDADQVEILYGTLMLKNSKMTSFPKVKNLRLVEQRPKEPVLVIEDNPKLHDLEALYNMTFSVHDFKTAVKITNNPNLCIAKDYKDEPFRKTYLGSVRTCSADKLLDLLFFANLWIPIFLIVIFKD